MSNPELGNPSPYDDEIENLMNTTGMSRAEAELRAGHAPGRPHGGAYVDRPVAARRHRSRRGGRSFPEPSDSELDGEWNVPYERPTDDQRAINFGGIALVRLMGELVQLDEYRALSPEAQEASRQALIARHTRAQ